MDGAGNRETDEAGVREFELAREPRSVRVLNDTLEHWLTARGVPEAVLRAVQDRKSVV